MGGSRQRTKPTTETDVLARSRHRCALCWGLYRDSSVKQGQLAHLDQNPANSGIDNLVFLCLPHHDQYDSKTSQSKNFTRGEVERYQGELDQHLSAMKGTPWPDFGPTPPSQEQSEPAVRSSVEVYDRRIVVYRALRSFLLEALRGATVSLKDLGQFADATDEALFLFGPEISDYLGLVYSKGVDLHYTSNRIRDERLSPQEDYSQVVRQNADVLNWLSQQLDNGRQVFAKELRLG